RENETVGEIKIDLLAPDRFLKIKESNLQKMTFVTLMLAINGDQAWIDRKISRPVADDGSSEIVRTQSTAPPQIRDSTTGMRNTAAGNTVIRSTQPGSSSTTERTVLGMRIPTPQGRTRNTSMSRMEEDIKASAQSADGSNRPPGLEDPQIRATLEKQLRNEFACLMFAWLITPPSSFTLQFSYGGEIKNEHGNVEAIDLSGPDVFAARLFVDQASSRPAMISYRELINQKTGYVVSAGENGRNKETKPEDLQEIAIQLYFSDYRKVNNVIVPFQIVKAINGVPVEEWKIEKYKINPDLKPKRFEKK
ncbi:MAG: hypothetical protein L0220_14375, partial [Acidobacteria bacterium]|nr:hypothetical protein [Acidobacteriota bacterium]